MVLLLACTSASVKLGSDTGDGAPAGEDTSVDTSVDTSADTSADTAADTGVLEARFEGEVEGSVQITQGRDRVTLTCSGPFVLVAREDGSAVGEARCDAGNGAFVGPVEGSFVPRTVFGGAVLTGTFTYTGFEYEGEAEVDGSIVEGVLSAFVADQDEGIAMSLVINASLLR